MSESVSDPNGVAAAQLREIVTNYGARALDDPALLARILPDLMSDAPRERRIVEAAAAAGVAERLNTRVTHGASPASAIDDVARLLSDQHALTLNAATWVVTAYAYALGHAPDLTPDGGQQVSAQVTEPQMTQPARTSPPQSAPPAQVPPVQSAPPQPQPQPQPQQAPPPPQATSPAAATMLDTVFTAQQQAAPPPQWDPNPVVSAPPPQQWNPNPVVSAPPPQQWNTNPVVSAPPPQQWNTTPMVSAPPVASGPPIAGYPQGPYVPATHGGPATPYLHPVPEKKSNTRKMLLLIGLPLVLVLAGVCGVTATVLLASQDCMIGSWEMIESKQTWYEPNPATVTYTGSGTLIVEFNEDGTGAMRNNAVVYDVGNGWTGVDTGTFTYRYTATTDEVRYTSVAGSVETVQSKPGEDDVTSSTDNPQLTSDQVNCADDRMVLTGDVNRDIDGTTYRWEYRQVFTRV